MGKLALVLGVSLVGAIVAGVSIDWCLNTIQLNAQPSKDSQVKDLPRTGHPTEPSERDGAPSFSVSPQEHRTALPEPEPPSRGSRRVAIKQLDSAHSRAYARLQDVLRQQKLPALPADGFILTDDLAALVPTVTALDADVDRTYAEMMRTATTYVGTCEKEILGQVRRGEPPQYEVYRGQELKTDPMDIVSVVSPARHPHRYVVRTPDSVVVREKRAWLTAVAAEAEFADKVIRPLVQP